MANSCLSAARAALRVPCCHRLSSAGAQLQLQYASVFPRPAARAHHRLVAASVGRPVARRRRGLAVTAMASQEEAAATAVEEVQEGEVEGQPQEQAEVAEQEPEQGGVVEAASSDDGGEKEENEEESGASEVESAATTKLYFGNLPYNCDSAQLAAVVQDYASPEMVEVLYDRTTGRSRGFAFVTMTTIQDCELVIKNLDGTLYGGRTMKVNFADKPKPKLPLYPETEHKLFVGNLSWTVTGEMSRRCSSGVATWSARGCSTTARPAAPGATASSATPPRKRWTRLFPRSTEQKWNAGRSGSTWPLEKDIRLQIGESCSTYVILPCDANCTQPTRSAIQQQEKERTPS